MGRWFRISSIPLPNEVVCDHVEINYTLFDNGLYIVNICCNSKWEALNSKVVTAIPVDCNPSTLFIKNDSLQECSSIVNYIILKTDYTTYTVVGDPTLSSLYILSREKTMCQTLYNDLIKYCEKLGYNVKLLKIDENSIIKC